MIDEKILLEQIKTFKRSQKSTNCDYLTGYISALSAVEGMIAEQPKVGECDRNCADCWKTKLVTAPPKLHADAKHGEWIPVSERLPKRQDSNNTFLRMYLVCSKRGVVHMGFRDEDSIWRTVHGNRIYNEVAWMPPPEPYKG